MPHLKTRMPTSSDAIQHADMKPAFNQNLFEQTLQRDNLQAAWKRVRANKGAAGVDSMTISEFPDWVKSGQWDRVETDLRAEQYQPLPVRRVEIDKPDGGKRQLGIPTVIDRVIQQAIAQVLGGKDRFIPLPRRTLYALRCFWKTHKHPRFLFPLTTVLSIILWIAGYWRRL
ncbi:MAG: hypothetical protein V7735_25475 [Photobacterium frigidiphilum]